MRYLYVTSIVQTNWNAFYHSSVPYELQFNGCMPIHWMIVDINFSSEWETWTKWNKTAPKQTNPPLTHCTMNRIWMGLRREKWTAFNRTGITNIYQRLNNTTRQALFSRITDNTAMPDILCSILIQKLVHIVHWNRSKHRNALSVHKYKINWIWWMTEGKSNWSANKQFMQSRIRMFEGSLNPHLV